MSAQRSIETYLTDLETRVSEVINYVVPDEGYSGLIWLNLEDWQPYWRRDVRETYPHDNPADEGQVISGIPGSLESVWRRYLAEVLEEPEVVGYSSASFEDRAAMEDHFESRYINIARPEHDTIYSTVRALRPNAQVGEYGWPAGSFYAARPDDPRYPFYVAANNTYVPRMARNWDCLLPSFYPVHQAVTTAPSGPLEMSDTGWTNFYVNTAREYQRMKSVCGGMRTYWFLGPRFFAGPVGTPMNSHTTRLQLGMARHHKADGVLIWDFVGDDNPETQAKVLSGLVPMLPRLKSYLANLHGKYLAINSPIAIGPIGP